MAIRISSPQPALILSWLLKAQRSRRIFQPCPALPQKTPRGLLPSGCCAVDATESNQAGQGPAPLIHLKSADHRPRLTTFPLTSFGIIRSIRRERSILRNWHGCSISAEPRRISISDFWRDKKGQGVFCSLPFCLFFACCGRALICPVIENISV